MRIRGLTEPRHGKVIHIAELGFQRRVDERRRNRARRRACITLSCFLVIGLITSPESFFAKRTLAAVFERILKPMRVGFPHPADPVRDIGDMNRRGHGIRYRQPRPETGVCAS